MTLKNLVITLAAGSVAASFAAGANAKAMGAPHASSQAPSSLRSNPSDDDHQAPEALRANPSPTPSISSFSMARSAPQARPAAPARPSAPAPRVVSRPTPAPAPVAKPVSRPAAPVVAQGPQRPAGNTNKPPVAPKPPVAKPTQPVNKPPVVGQQHPSQPAKPPAPVNNKPVVGQQHPGQPAKPPAPVNNKPVVGQPQHPLSPIANRSGFGRDSRHNILPTDAQGRIQQSAAHIQQLRSNRAVMEFAQSRQTLYARNFMPAYNRFRPIFTDVNAWRGHAEFFHTGWWIQPWYFYAYGWDVVAFDISAYFYDPYVAYFWGDYDVTFWSNYYGSNWTAYYNQYPDDLGQGFRYVGVFFPTQDLYDLNELIAGLDIGREVMYRRSMTVLAERLNIAAESAWREQLGSEEVAIYHYQIMPGYNGILVDGVVNGPTMQLPFRAFLSLQDSEQTNVFSIGDNVPPSAGPEDLLNGLNSQVTGMGGVLEDAPTVLPMP